MKKLLKTNELFPAVLLTMIFSCRNLAWNMTKSLSFLFLYPTFQKWDTFKHVLVNFIKQIPWKGWSSQNFWVKFLLCIFKFYYNCTKFHYPQVAGEKVSIIKIFSYFGFCMTTSIVRLNLLSLKEPIIAKVCFKTFVTWNIKFHNFSNIWSKSVLQIFLESLQGRMTWIKTKYENYKRFCCLKGLENKFFSQ